MKKILLILVLTLLLLFTSCTWIGAASRDESSTSVSVSSLPSSSIQSSGESEAQSSIAQSVSVAHSVPLSGTWEFFAEYNGSKFHYHLVFGEDGSIEYIASWYMSDTAERYKGTYAYDGKIMELDTKPTLYPETTPPKHCFMNVEVEGDNLKISYHSGDKMYAYQGDETAIWTKVVEQ